jgi:uncharacterized coiled-coil protein SlyX
VCCANGTPLNRNYKREDMSDILKKFDPMAMVQPKTVEDLMAICNEAQAEVAKINEAFQKMTQVLSESDKKTPPKDAAPKT